jgi:hypothetical protein
MKIPSNEQIVTYVVGSLVGAFIGTLLLVVVFLAIDLILLAVGKKLGLVDSLGEFPLLVGFVCCLGAYHMGLRNGHEAGVAKAVKYQAMVREYEKRSDNSKEDKIDE